MKIDEIKELIQALETSSLTSLEISQGETSVKLEKNYMQPAAILQAAPVEQPVSMASAASALPSEAAPAVQKKGKAVSCPLVGVFYTAPSPNDAPFVAVGDTVKKGDVLCIVEAMKLMNEITAEEDGVITEICAENGQVVEYGQPLFYMA